MSISRFHAIKETLTRIPAYILEKTSFINFGLPCIQQNNNAALFNKQHLTIDCFKEILSLYFCKFRIPNYQIVLIKFIICQKLDSKL